MLFLDINLAHLEGSTDLDDHESLLIDMKKSETEKDGLMNEYR